MLKHPEITLRRVAAFIKYDLEGKWIGESAPLKIEFCAAPHSSEREAAKGPWQEVEPGFKYGPAYQTFWFRITGRIPKEFAGKEIVAFLMVGSERTLWKDNSPWRGVDYEHEMVPLGSAIGGQKLNLIVQAYTRNPQCRVHLKELPREELVETVEKAEIAVLDRDLLDLYYDCEFAHNLLGGLDSATPEYATLLRALNEVCNVYRAGQKETLARGRKLIRDALGSIPGESKHTVTPVGHAHLDTAWLWPLDITHKKMAHTAATQLQLMDRYPEYVFVHSQASQYEWVEQEHPELFKRIKEAIRRGQWEPVGSMWVEADCNLTGSESLIRQFLYGRRYFREKLDFNTEDMWLPDVFGYSAALPQILTKFNIKYFLTQKISWNQTNKFPHNTFWWKGIDGSRVWSHFPPADTYIGDGTPQQILQSVKNHRDHARSDNSLYVFGWGDGGGGPTEKHLEFLRRARMAPLLPDVQLGRKAIDFFREAYAKSRDLSTWHGELYFELHRGTYTSQAANKQHNRYCEYLLRDAEWLACFTPGFPKQYPKAELEAAWKLVLLNQFHDIIPGSSVREVYEDSDRDYAAVRETGERIVKTSLAKIGSSFDTAAMHRPVALFQNAALGCTTFLPWSEESVPTSVVCGDEALPCQVVEHFGAKSIAFATPAAAVGAVAVADLSDSPPSTKYRLKASNRKIENSDFAVRFDGNGNITSIESLEDGTEFVEQGKVANLFQLFEDKPLFWSAWDVDPYAFETWTNLFKSESFEIVERGPVRVAAQVVKTFGNSSIRQRISLGPTVGIRFDTEIDWHEEDKLLKVAFPVNVSSARASYEIQFGHVERPTHYNTSWDLARFEVCAQKWVDLSEADQGVALLNDSKYGHDIHGNIIRQTLLRAPKAPDPQCDMGIHRFTYVLMPHFGPLNYAGVVHAAYALNCPTRHAWLEPAAGETGSLPPFIGCEDRNIIIESVKKAEDSNALIARLYECHNARGFAELTCARKVKSCWLCDLEEKPLQQLEVHDGIVIFDYKPFEIVTLRLDV